MSSGPLWKSLSLVAKLLVTWSNEAISAWRASAKAIKAAASISTVRIPSARCRSTCVRVSRLHIHGLQVTSQARDDRAPGQSLDIISRLDRVLPGDLDCLSRKSKLWREESAREDHRQGARPNLPVRRTQ